jgi:hypothetical protein
MLGCKERDQLELFISGFGSSFLKIMCWPASIVFSTLHC